MNDLTVLSILMQGDRYGLEIIKAAKEVGLSLFLGSLYNILKRLEKHGLVESYWGEDTSERGGNRRRYYKITGKGETTFEDAKQSYLQLWGIPKLAQYQI